MTRILVVEDNLDLALGLRNNLEIEGYAVDVVHDGREVRPAARRLRPDLVILDLMLPGLDGFQVLRELRAEDGVLPVLVLTARDAEPDKVRGLRLGADDYVTKPFGVLELLARVEALLRRAQPPKPPGGAYQLGDVTVDAGARRAHRGGVEVGLSPKEMDLLLALLERRGEAVAREQLMRRVWGYDASVISRTLDTHVAELRRKLERDPAHPEWIVTVRRMGYRIEDIDDC